MAETIFKAGQVVYVNVPFTGNKGQKLRPALIINVYKDDIIILPITSNLRSNGILITKSDGAAEDSIIKLNNIFTISKDQIMHVFFELEKNKRKEVYTGLVSCFCQLLE